MIFGGGGIPLKITFRAAFQEQFETLGLLQKIKYFKDHDIEYGSPVHDDVPCKLYEGAKDRRVPKTCRFLGRQ